MPLDRELTVAMLGVVRTRMAEQKMTGRDLAARMGVPTNTVAKHLRDEGVTPLEEWEAMALALGCNRVEELLDEARRRL